MILSVLTMKSIRLRALLCGRPSIVIRDGVPDQREMRRARFTVDELMEELRGKGYTDLTRIRYAILETNGQLSVLPCAGEKPPSCAQLGVAAQESGLPAVVVSDGRVMGENLHRAGYDRAWLDVQITAHGCSDASQVFLMTVDEAGDVYLCPKERREAGV